MKKSKLATKLRYWFPLSFFITFICGLIYVAVQQDFRTTANDPQIQIAEDAAVALQAGQSAQSVLPARKVDIQQSLAPYVIVFDASGKPITSSATLDNTIPTVPSGVFQHVLQNGEDRFTWEPQNGVRSAVVVTHYTNEKNSGFVLAGRSLREVEKREQSLTMEVAGAWIVTLAISFVATIIFI